MKVIKQVMWAGVCVYLAAGAVANAGWFSREPEAAPKANSAPRPQQKYVLNVPDKKTEQELLGMLSGRKALEENVGVLRRLLQSRSGLQRSVREALNQEFGIAPEMKWTYQSDTMTIVETRAATNGTVDAVAKAPFQRKLADKAQEEKLLRMKRDAATVVEQMIVLQEILVEQESALKRQLGLLAAKFSLKPEKMYYYDRKTMTLFEVMGQANGQKRMAPRQGDTRRGEPKRDDKE
jgi:hypothetical protein